MSKVLEIGCGSAPVEPRRFMGDAFRIASDIDIGELKTIDEASVPLLIADARLRLPFPNTSIDHVVAKDVFGDPNLGFTMEEFVGFSADSHEEWVEKAAQRFRHDTLYEAIEDSVRLRLLSEEVEWRKVEIMTEVGRVLLSGGSLVIIETRTPDVAREFMHAVSLKVGNKKDRERIVRETPSSKLFTVNEVSSARKQRFYCNEEELLDPDLRVWQLVRA